MPLSPPTINSATKARLNSIGVCSLTCPPQIVPIQLNILTPVGMAMAIVERAKAALAAGPRPTVNMWWDHTKNPMKAMDAPAITTNG